MNVVLAYGNTSLSFSPTHDKEYTSQKVVDGLQFQDNKNDSSPLSLLILAEEEETETNEEFLHAAIFIVAFFQCLNWGSNSADQPSGDYAHIGKKVRTQNIYTFIETFRI
jgi:hypothetical protein